MSKSATHRVAVAEVGADDAVLGELPKESVPTISPKINVTGEAMKGMGRWYWFTGIFDWYPAHMSKGEKSLVRKLDLAILAFCCVQFFLKYLDSTNITNAYNSGMSADLKLFGNELNYFNVTYNCGYMLAQIPLLLALSRPGWARWIFPGAELLWGIVTFTQSRAQNAGQLYAIRFILGMCEVPSFSGTNYILGSWYTSEEIYKRAGTWYISSGLGSMFSGYLQTAAYNGLNGVGGLAGWRWLFIVDGIITLPLAFVGFFTFPGLPSSKKPWFLTDEEHALATIRMNRQKSGQPTKITKATARRILTKWHFYVAVLMNMVYNLTSYPTNYMSLFLKRATDSNGNLIYTIQQVNTIPTAVSGVAALSSWLTASLVNVISIVPLFLAINAVGLFANIVLRIWNVPIALKFFAYICLGVNGSNNALMFGLANQMTRRDNEERAVTMAAMLMGGWALNAWVPVLEWPTVDAPQWMLGYTVQIPMTVLLTAVCLMAVYLHRREERQRESLGLNDVEEVSSREPADSEEAEYDEKTA
ncbi:MFS general substrate transporter [Calocera cornea HHB12733]|uniref:MFS general substrate transporter n=1 Tax=Calocera cornea HHB12733 TaxID=1353952 RepID=A0A165DDK9_9BASI|nr:MFS general substrate transporter [Calocera cornea HHB12733]